MALQLKALVIDTHEPAVVAEFWAQLLGRAPEVGPGDSVVLQATHEPGFEIRFAPGASPKQTPNRTHLDLTSDSPEHYDQQIALALAHGGQHLDIGQDPYDGHTVLADPEGNELCVIESVNRFLADTDRIGAVNCDGTAAVGRFWSEALGWPLVWDQDEETAIQSPQGGSKITWSGPPLAPKLGKERLHFDLLPVDSDQDAEAGRLEELGARRTDIGQGQVPWVVMVDPDGNELCVLAP